MQDLIFKASKSLVTYPEEDLNDIDSLVAKTLVSSSASLTALSQAGIQLRGKKVTVKKQEELGRLISKILYEACILISLLDIDPEGFSVGNLTELSDQFYEEYQQDSVMCSMSTHRSYIYIMDVYFCSPQDLEDDPPGDFENIEEALAFIFASCIILCERFDLDLENIIWNAGLINQPEAE
jgi:hypothetical protein